MDGRKLLLFGIAVITYSGLLVVGRGVGNVDDPLYWGMHAGLAVSAIGLFRDELGSAAA